MAFEAYRSQDRNRPKRRRRVTYTLSMIVHAALVVVGIAYSFWHVEELSPPSVHVTFMSSMAPPPPPPPPPAGGGAKKKVQIKPKPTVVPTKIPDIVQPLDKPKPPEKPKQEDEDEDEPGGQAGGVTGGTVGGTVGGTIGGAVGGTVGGTAGAGPAKFVPPNVGDLQRLSGDKPAFPAQLRKAGAEYAVIAKICVSRAGAVETVT